MATLAGIAGSVLVSAAPTPAVAATSSAYSLSYPYSGGGALRWNPCQRAIAYRVNLSLSARTSYGRKVALADVQTAVGRITNATGMRFHYLGTTTSVPTGTSWWQHTGDAEVVIAWVNEKYTSTKSSLLLRSGGGYVAGTGGWRSWQWGTALAGSAPTAAIVRGYLVINAAQNASFRPGFGSGTTRGGLLLHELGHVVGLNHVQSSAQIMYPVLVPRSRAASATGDLNGLTRVGRPAGCIGIPAWAGAPKDMS